MPPNRTKRGAGYCQIEIDSLLDLLEEHLPLSTTEWERIEHLHRCRFPAEDRTQESLKRKFQDLYRTKAPTGDPNIPNDVRRAKEILKKMQMRTCASDCEGDDNLEVVDEVSKEGKPKEDTDNNSITSVESRTSKSASTAKLLVKMPLSLASRKRKSSSDKDDLQDIKEILKIQVLQREKDREDERRRREEDERRQSNKQSHMDKMMMALIVAVAPNAAPALADFMKQSTNEDHSDSEKNKNNDCDK